MRIGGLRTPFSLPGDASPDASCGAITGDGYPGERVGWHGRPGASHRFAAPPHSSGFVCFRCLHGSCCCARGWWGSCGVSGIRAPAKAARGFEDSW